MDFDGYNLRTQDIADVLATAEKALAVRLIRQESSYGTQGATIGFPSSDNTWVHLTWRRSTVVDGGWVSVEFASALTGVRKPALLRSHRWCDARRDVVWRADESELVQAAAVAGTGVLTDDPGLSDEWWDDLRNSLGHLAKHETRRVVMGQEHLGKRIAEVFGASGADTTITEWVTAHGDMHWGNVTAPQCYILDWESWGVAPRGYDAAILWGHSLPVPGVANRIQREFAADLSSRSGRLAQLLFCSNVIRLAKKGPTPGPLVEPATTAAARLLEELTSLA
ncbi:hypothetical protein [Actinokineospora inagensis]|uniref:hypothetical protein n=1 Tax=Actinokineospora inagensis TaxID=103730 RepID=UPI000479D52B|nr:hypothetical protein [Actinokineospora inagensis]